jgi:hypothetical protein
LSLAERVRELVDPGDVVAFLSGILADDKQRAADRLVAAKELLDRGWGKAHASMTLNAGEDLLARVLALTPAQRAKRIEELQAKREGAEGEG